MGFQENLTCGQIVDQVSYMREMAHERFDRDISNVVFMGMGEPLLNYDALLASLEILTHRMRSGFRPSGLRFLPSVLRAASVIWPMMLPRSAWPFPCMPPMN